MNPYRYCAVDWRCHTCGWGPLESTCLGDYERRYVEQHAHGCPLVDVVESVPDA